MQIAQDPTAPASTGSEDVSNRRAFGLQAAAFFGLTLSALPSRLFAHDDEHHVHVGDLTIHPVSDSTYLGFHRPVVDPATVRGHGAFSAQLVGDLPLPADLTADLLKLAHGTVMSRPNGDIIWGLGNYGLIEYRSSEGYQVPRRLPVEFPKPFNLHGGELFISGPNEYIAVASDSSHSVFVVNTKGGEVRVIGAPEGVLAKDWKPTDVAVYAPGLDALEKGAFNLLITNGYGSPAVVYEFNLHENRFTRKIEVPVEGKGKTPHGISLGDDSTFVLAQREAHLVEERVIGVDAETFGKLKRQFKFGSGVRPCDFDWHEFGDKKGEKLFACVPVLRGPGSNPGGVAICDSEGKIVSVIDINRDRPAIQHIHDACLISLDDAAVNYHGEPGGGFVATSWNPGTAPVWYRWVAEPAK